MVKQVVSVFAVFFMFFGIVLVSGGCALDGSSVSINISPEGKELIERVAARRLGAALMALDPSIGAPAKLFISVVRAIDDPAMAPELVDRASDYLASKMAPDDPLLVQDLNDLLSFVRVNADNKEMLRRLKFLSAAFGQGLAVVKADPG